MHEVEEVKLLLLGSGAEPDRPSAAQRRVERPRVTGRRAVVAAKRALYWSCVPHVGLAGQPGASAGVSPPYNSLGYAEETRGDFSQARGPQARAPAGHL
ncbi:hypothetical protein THAOC_23021, partial [Thalassiosira oceanica]